MGMDSRVDWCDHTFNPWHGCCKVKDSPACDHCYAERQGKRQHVPWGPDVPREYFRDWHWKQPEVWNARARLEGGALVFCGSMCDVFELHRREDQRLAMARERERLWSLIERTPDLTWLLLTKRPENIAEMVPPAWLTQPRPNVWYGATIEDMDAAVYKHRQIEHLVKVPAAGRFISCEPLRGGLWLIDWLVPRGGRGASKAINWVITGGERNGRASHPDWFRDLRDQCQVTGVPFFFKQWGDHMPVPPIELRAKARTVWVCPDCGMNGDNTKADLQAHVDTRCVGDPLIMYRVGHKAAGHLLDGVEHRAFPEGLG